MNQSIKIKYALMIIAVAIVISIAVVPIVRENLLDVRDAVLLSQFEQLETIGELAACDIAPSIWQYKFRGYKKFIPVNSDQLPLDGSVLPLEFAELGTVVLGESYGFADPRPNYGPHIVDTKRPGQCRYFYVEPDFDGEGPSLRTKIMVPVTVIIVASVLVLWASLTYPLIRRIKKIVARARSIIANNFIGKIEEINDELGEIANAFNTASETAAERLAEKTLQENRLKELLANLAHDVRTPLSSLKVGMSRLMNESYDEEIGRALRAEVEHLDGVFANIAAMMQLEASTIPLNFSQIEINRLIDNISIRFSILAKDRGIEINTSLPESILIATVDPIAMEQAISNLVHNAVKFSKNFVALLLFDEQGEIVLQVIDDGPGVNEAEIPHLTERRFQGGAGKDRGRPGLGLGLAIVKEIVLRHNGKFSIDRHQDGGCIAEIRLARSLRPEEQFS